MAINRNVFIHDSDKAALKALRAIPGFAQVSKAFLSVWNEKMVHIQNMSTNIKISDKQLKKYHDMLPPICDKLGIDIPDFYLTLDVTPNAWTTGDTKPVIVMTSGLLETLPEELIPSVLAHECGHIACHHMLYTSMGNWLLTGAAQIPTLGKTIIYPLAAAFAYWMRCSEFSADRAAVLCDGTPDKMIEVCMRLAGFDKDIPVDANPEAFMEQASEYKELMAKGGINKGMELYMYGMVEHPLNAVRAYECKEWSGSEDFAKANEYFRAYHKSELPEEVPAAWTEKSFLGKNVSDVEKSLLDLGFENVELVRDTKKSFFTKSGTVTEVSINGRRDYKEGDWLTVDSRICVTYYQPLTEDEIAMMHPGEIKLPSSAKYYAGKPVSDVAGAFNEMGFENVEIEEIKDIAKEKDKNLGKVFMITVDKNPKFEKGIWVDQYAEIKILYHALKD